MTWETFLLFVSTEGLLCLSPGAAVFFVLSQALRRGPAKSLWGVGGILLANSMYFIVSAISLDGLFIVSHKLFFLIKWIGAAYLVFLGLRCFFSRHSVAALPEAGDSSASSRRILIDGFVLQAANPEALIFFAAILPQFIDPGRSVPFQMGILGASSVVIEFLTLLAYGQLASRALSAARNPRFEKLTNRLAGSFLIISGLGLARIIKA